MAKLKQSYIKLDAKNIEYKTLKVKLKSLKPPTKKSTVEKDKVDIKSLKKEIRELRIENLLKYCSDEINESSFVVEFHKNLSNNDKSIYENLFNGHDLITTSLLTCDEEKIMSVINDIDMFVDFSLGDVFRGIKGELNESEYSFINELKKTLSKHKESNIESDILKGLFSKSTDEVLNELKEYEKKFEKTK